MAKPKTPTARTIIDRRKELGWTASDLSAELVRATGNELWTARRVTRIENAEVHVTVEMLRDLALALRIDDVDYLVYGPTQRDAVSVLHRQLAEANEGPSDLREPTAA